MYSEEFTCRECGCTSAFPLHANTLMICPQCMSYITVVCDYGFGPVTPCEIEAGEISLGRVTEDSLYRYRLDSEYLGIHLLLRSRYLDAVYEARDIVIKTLKEKGAV